MKPSHFFTDHGPTLRVRITKQPVPTELEPYDVSRFEVGKVYDVGPRLAEALIVGGFAEPDTRTKDRPATKPGTRKK